MSSVALANTRTFLERSWPWLMLAAPVGVYAAWLASPAVPQVVRMVVPEVVRAIAGR